MWEETTAVLIVGLSSTELGDYTYYEEVLDGLNLSKITPFYDPPFENWIVGIPVAESWESHPREIECNLEEKIKAAKEEFFTLTGKCGKLYISPNIYFKETK